MRHYMSVAYHCQHGDAFKKKKEKKNNSCASLSAFEF
jgi:hypothetical protein